MKGSARIGRIVGQLEHAGHLSHHAYTHRAGVPCLVCHRIRIRIAARVVSATATHEISTFFCRSLAIFAKQLFRRQFHPHCGTGHALGVESLRPVHSKFEVTRSRTVDLQPIEHVPLLERPFGFAKRRGSEPYNAQPLAVRIERLVARCRSIRYVIRREIAMQYRTGRVLERQGQHGQRLLVRHRQLDRR